MADPANIRYLACTHLPGLPPISCLAIPANGEPIAIASGLESIRARAESAVPDIRVHSPYRDVERQASSQDRLLKDLRRRNRWQCVMSDIPLPGMPTNVDNAIRRMRLIKAPEEIDCMREAAALVSAAARHFRSIARPSMSELQAAAEINRFLLRNGSQCPSYPVIVASGPHTAYSHHTPTERTFRNGDVLTCDLCFYRHGYASDITRTFFLGRPSRQWQEVFAVVREAHRAAVAAIRPGVPLYAIDAAARDVIREHGYGPLFVHSTGHGIGLETHEPPSVRPSSRARCKPGMTITVEPGIYLPGQGGVRIEDEILVTPTGHEYLTQPSA